MRYSVGLSSTDWHYQICLKTIGLRSRLLRLSDPCCTGPLDQQQYQQLQPAQPDESHPAPEGLVQHRPLHSPQSDEEATLNLHSVGTTCLKIASLPELDSNQAAQLWQLVDAVLDIGSVPHAALASSRTLLSHNASPADTSCGVASDRIGEHCSHASSAGESASAVLMLGSAATSFCNQSHCSGVSMWLPIIEPKQVLLTSALSYHPM